MLKILILFLSSLLFCQIAADFIPDYSNILLEDTETVDNDEAENSLWKEKDDFIYNETQKLDNRTWDSLPLRVPPDLREHVKTLAEPKANLRTGRQEEPIAQNPSPPQGFSNPPVIAPGVYSCGHQGSDMFVNVINPRYPGHDTGAGTCHFRLVKHKPEICQIRVDFVDTEMLSPVDGNCDDQYMTVSGSIWATGFKRICGINPDQHFYIQLDNKASFQHIDFTITTIRSNKPYKFGLWITQINCQDGSAVQSPPGCTQFHFGSEGILKTFNFEGVQYMGSQNYKICIRSERGACFVGFAADANHFMLQIHPSDTNLRFRNNNRNSARLPAGRGDEDCTTDFILIPGGRGNITRYGPTYDRYCGGQLNTESNKEESEPIYSEITSPVIWLQFVTGPRESHILSELKRLKNNNNNNNLNDKYDGTGPGFRLRYSQLNNCVHQSFFGN